MMVTLTNIILLQNTLQLGHSSEIHKKALVYKVHKDHNSYLQCVCEQATIECDEL